ncbi:MAG TPA: plastocyanin/azurin family copper-binding protein [Nitrososphaeraceae archaeon]|jgi:plastocyanin|nr:plastocyanin/azurin family copper-binding protein [Nitrososphaeraceae archaeon]
MGLNEKIIFLGILGMGAITGVISYVIFSELPPTPGDTKSIYRQDLPPPTAQATTKTEKIDPSTVKADVTLTILEGAATQGNPDYDPDELSVKKGNIIKVENVDLVPHTVTNGAGPSDPNSAKIFDTSLIMGGESGILQTEEIVAGEYTYYCTVHPYMTGTLKIE